MENTGAYTDPMRKIASEIAPEFKRRALFFIGQMERAAEYLIVNPTDTAFVADRMRHEMESFRSLFGEKVTDAGATVQEQKEARVPNDG